MWRRQVAVHYDGASAAEQQVAKIDFTILSKENDFLKS
jgi:hypothetical protein